MRKKTAPVRTDSNAVATEVDALLTPFHAERLARLGPEDSGLYAHYQTLVERGSLMRPAERERMGHILRHMPRYQHYVVYRAGLGELGFGLAHAGCRVTVWDANGARRAAIQAGYEYMAAASPAIRDNFRIAGREPETIGLDPAETSLGLAFDCGLPSDDEVATVLDTFHTHALLYEPRLFLRIRDQATADAEVRELLEKVGFDTFRPPPVLTLGFASRGPIQPPPATIRLIPGERARPIPEGACKGLIAIAGGSYSGSTLLNMLLDSHPEIGGGGELHWLTKDSRRAVCAVCGEACPVWTPEVQAAARHDNIYDLAATVMGRPYVCDASKTPDWLSPVLRTHPDLPKTTVLLTKHPIRQAASFLHKAAFRDDMVPYRDPDYVLGQLAANYRRALDLLSFDLIVRYEDLIADPRGTISRILAGQGLAWADSIEEWQSRPHHHVGGNAGPLVQLDRSRRSASEALARKYAGDGLFMDDSYREVLDRETFERIMESPLTAEMCKLFDYGSLPFGDD